MADTVSPPRSTRTPLARVKGLGAAGHGADHWWQQRLTGAANALLGIAFVVIVASLAGRSYGEAVRIVAQPAVAIVLVLTVISASLHMRLGMQVILEDYVHGEGLKTAALVANTFYAVAVAVACLYAIVKIGLSPIY